MRDIDKNVIDAYQAGATADQAAKMFGYKSSSACYHIMRKFGISRRNMSEVMTKRTCDHNFFENIDTEEKAYWLGFIAADGCVIDKKLTISLSRKDYNHINKFKKDIKSDNINKEVIWKSFNKEYNGCSITITSGKIVSDLFKCNIVPRKSLIGNPPTNIPNNLKRYFWRGMIDGDGWISHYKSGNTKRWKIGLCGNYNYLKEFNDFVKENFNYSVKISKQGNIFTLTYTKKDILPKLVKFLYEDCSVYLDRKKDKATLLIGSSL